MNFKWVWRILMPIAVIGWGIELARSIQAQDWVWSIFGAAAILSCFALTWLAWARPERMTSAE